MATSDRPIDIVLFGATGFVGRLTASYLAGAAPAGVRIALAARSRDRLEAVRTAAGDVASDWELIVADSTDAGAMHALAERTAVVATTVGPYARYGAALVEACAQAGTHYADLTGELLFVRDCVDRWHSVAARTGARLVHACGFDSVPSDLGVQMMHERAQRDSAGDLGRTTLVAHMVGGVSGGTIDSLRTEVDEVRAHPGRAAVLADPYALSPDRSAEPTTDDGTEPPWAHLDGDVGGWVAPFVMGPFNSRVVRRSNALSGWSYGRGFRYREVMSGGPGPAGAVIAGSIAAAQVAMTSAMRVAPARAVLDRLLPKPGSGPSTRTQQRGSFRMEILATTTGGLRYRGTVAADKDPGYSATAVMLGESALCLALDHDRLPATAGVLTPATAMGGVLLGRLVAAGFRADVERL